MGKEGKLSNFATYQGDSGCWGEDTQEILRIIPYYWGKYPLTGAVSLLVMS